MALPVLEGVAVVQERVVMHKLDVPRLELHAALQGACGGAEGRSRVPPTSQRTPRVRLHLHGRVVGQGVPEVEGLDVRRGEARRTGEALRRVDVLALVDRREAAVVEGEDGDGKERRCALGHLAAPVRRDRPQQRGQEVGARREDAVVERADRHERRRAAAEGAREAEERDCVGGARRMTKPPFRLRGCLGASSPTSHESV